MQNEDGEGYQAETPALSPAQVEKNMHDRVPWAPKNENGVGNWDALPNGDALVEFSQLFRFKKQSPEDFTVKMVQEPVIQKGVELVTQIKNSIKTSLDLIAHLEQNLGLMGKADVFYGPFVLDAPHNRYEKIEEQEDGTKTVTYPFAHQSTTCLMLKDLKSAAAVIASGKLVVVEKVIKGKAFYLVPFDPRQREFEGSSLTTELFGSLEIKDMFIGVHGDFAKVGGYAGSPRKLWNALGGVFEHGLPMKTWENDEYLVKLHMPQPELPGGHPNGQFEEQLVWTVSTKSWITNAFTGRSSFSEAVKFGVRSPEAAEKINALVPNLTQAGNILAMPFNPAVCAWCFTFNRNPKMDTYPELREDLSEYMTIKDGDFSDAHFVLENPKDVAELLAQE